MNNYTLIERVFGEMSINELLSRIRIDNDSRLTKMRLDGTIIEEDYRLTDIEIIELNTLLSRKFFSIYRNFIMEDKFKTFEGKMVSFGLELYLILRRYLGFTPDLMYKDKVTVMMGLSKYLVDNKEDYHIVDDDLIVLYLVSNTDLGRLGNIKDYINIGIWSGVKFKERGSMYISMYLGNTFYNNVSCLEYFNYMVESGYRDTESVDRLMSLRGFRVYLGDEDKLRKRLKDYMWSYGHGVDWRSKLDALYEDIRGLNVDGLSVNKENPTQVSLVYKGGKLLITLTDLISLEYISKGQSDVIYNDEYYVTTKEVIQERLHSKRSLNPVLIGIASIIFKNIDSKVLDKRA